MQTDEILKHLTIDDLPESMGLFIDLFEQKNVDEIVRERYYKNDGLDLIRYLIKHCDGVTINPPAVRTMKSLIIKYIKSKLKENPDIHINRLSYDTGLSEKTIKEYIRDAGCGCNN